jgi:hypothetical protein
MLSKQQTHVAQCAFFLIDNTPECPQDMEPRAFTDDAITQHLARHTYTYRAHGKPGRKHAKEVTIQWMRKWFTRLCEKPMTKDFQRKPGEHAAGALFRLGSGVIPDHIKAKFQYDPDNTYLAWEISLRLARRVAAKTGLAQRHLRCANPSARRTIILLSKGH